MNKTFITHYANINNIAQIYGLMKDVNKNTAIAAIIIPHSAAWCEADIPTEKRNTVTLDKDYARKYCETMKITERTFRKIVKELQPVILKQKEKDVYYVNPFFASHGDGHSVSEFREYCVKNKFFIPFNFVGKACKTIDAEWCDYVYSNLIFDADDRRKFSEICNKNDEELRELLDKNALAYKHNCLYTNLDRVARFSAFVDAKLGVTDVFVWLFLSCQANFVKNQSSAECNNVVSMSTKEQKRIAAKFGVSDRAIRDTLKKLCGLSLLHKCEHESGKYIVNPFLAAKGEQSRIIALQNNFLAKFGDDYFHGCASGDIGKDAPAVVTEKEPDSNFDVV